MEDAIYELEEFSDENDQDCKFDIINKFGGRKRGKGRNWVKLKEFEDATEAEKYVDKANIWRKCSTKHNSNGAKVEYRCSKGQYRQNECPAGIYLLYHAECMKVSLFQSEFQHENHSYTPLRGLNENAKEFITDMFNIGIETPNAIIFEFRKAQMLEPPKNQLTNFLRTLRKQKYEPSTISSTQLIEWCKSNEKPADTDSLFVVNYAIQCDGESIEKQDLKIVMSTMRLLDNLTKTDLVQVDATYKFIWQGYPVIIIGSSDKTRVFHPFAILVCQRENETDFGFLFETLKNFRATWKPSVLMADRSTAITHAFNRAFSTTNTRLMCYSHMVKVIEKRLKTKLTNELRNDICVLQCCDSDELFDLASKLFVEKWAQKGAAMKNFIKYFENEWLEENRLWYEGAALGYPSTNNGLEAIHASIEREHTLRQRLPIGQFLNNLGKLLYKWSKNRDPLSPNYQKFHLKPEILLKDWTDAHNWAQSNKRVLNEKEKYYFTATNVADEITVDKIINFKGKEWSNFEDFKQARTSIRVVELKDKEFVCSCSNFLKEYKCKHALGLMIRLKLIDVPAEAKTVPCKGVKRKRGRPAKPKVALLIQ